MFGSLSNKVKLFLEDPDYRICKILIRYVKPDLIPDRMFLKYQFHYVFGYHLDLNNPRTYNEKLQWLKLYDHNPLYTTLVDKFAVKKWVAEKIGKEYVIPTIAVYETADQIDIAKLPDRFVLKCTHDSGSFAICRDKESFDVESAKRMLDLGLKNDFYKKHREWPYKNVPRRIIAEQFLEDNRSSELRDYKFFCMDGKCKSVLIVTNKTGSGKTYYDYFDFDFNHLDFTRGHPNSPFKVSKPELFEEMKALSEELSEGITNVRCDFYEANGRIYFGEMTFFPASGIIPFRPDKFDLEWGGWIKLPPKRHQ